MNITPDEWRVISKLFDAVLDLPSDARDRWLDTLPPEHTPYRETLRALLVAHQKVETNDFLGGGPKVGGVESSSEIARASSFAPGAIVGSYVIDAEIGRGGMGSVWRARRVDGSVKRNIALKIPHPGIFTAQLAARFDVERDILAELVHPNIARLYDAGITESGQPYLALEYVEGLPLTEYADRHGLDVRRRLDLAMQVLEAVRYAHSRLVIHRDLKPSNILVTEDGQVRLLDFGIAKLLPNSSLREAAMTEVGARALTPDYAAPEHITGGAITTATDVYSAGVVLYELLTGHRPYRLQRNSLGALEDAIVGTEPIRPSRADIAAVDAETRGVTDKKLRKLLAGDLDTIVLKSLKKNPDERYATADAMLRDLKNFLRNQPVLARPDSRWYVARKFISRHRLPVGIGVAAFSAVLIAAGIAFREADRATTERDRALQMSTRNEAVSSFLNTLITEAAQSPKPITVSEMLARSEKLAEAQYSGNAENRAAVLDMLGVYYYSTGDNARADALFARATTAMRDSSDWDLQARITCHRLAPAQQTKADARAVAELQAIVADPRTEAPQAVQCLIALANIARDSNKFADALRYDSDALRRVRAMPHPPDMQEATLLGELATAEHLSGDSNSAETHFAAALRKFVASGRDHSADAIAIRNNWAIMSSGAGDPKRALSLYDETLKVVAANDPGAPPPMYLIGNRANALYQVGRYRESIEMYESCVERASGLGLANCFVGLASVYRDLDELATARGSLDKAAVIIDAKAAPNSGMAFSLAIVRGKVALSEQRFDEARRELTSVVDRIKTTAHTVGALTVRAEVNLADGRTIDAESDARAALSLSQKLQGGKPYSNRTGLAWLILARALEQQGRNAETRSALESSVLHLTNTVDESHPALQEAQKLLAKLNTKAIS